MVGFGDNLARRKVAGIPPQRAENDDWRGRAAGEMAEIVGRSARRGVAVGIQDDQIRPEAVGQLDGALRPVGFQRGGPTALQERPQNFTGLGRPVDDQYAGQGGQATISSFRIVGGGAYRGD